MRAATGCSPSSAAGTASAASGSAAGRRRDAGPRDQGLDLAQTAARSRSKFSARAAMVKRGHEPPVDVLTTRQGRAEPGGVTVQHGPC